MKIKNIEDLHEIREKGLKKLLPDVPRVAVGLATCGIAAGGDEIYKKLKESFEKERIDVCLTKTGCFGMCHEEPIVNVRLPGKPLMMFGKVGTDKVDDIIQMIQYGEVKNGSAICKIEEWDHVVLVSPLVYGKGFTEIPHWNEIPFFLNQKKLVMRNAGITNPEDIEEYIAVGGYSAILKALKEYTPEQVVEEVKKIRITW